MSEIYLDHSAATPLDPRVLEAMMPYLSTEFANPSSLHKAGQRARHAVDESREKVASIVGAKQSEVIFTSGGTESNSLFIKGVGEFILQNLEEIRRGKYDEGAEFSERVVDVESTFVPHIITTKIEHESVLMPIEELAKKGFRVTYLDVGEDGVISLEDFEKAITNETVFVSIMYANNEIGTVQPVRECASILKKKNAEFSSARTPFCFSALLHTDACQGAPYLSLNVDELGVDSMTLNSGKIYGPKGVGCLYVRGGAHGAVKLIPQLLGGGQEYRMRSGTENVAGIVGFAAALEFAQENREEESSRLLILRDKLIDGILKIPNTRLNGSREKRLPNNVNVSFMGLHGETILVRLDMAKIAASSGSACSSGSMEKSHVIAALGGEVADDVWSRSATRFTLGHSTTEKEIEIVIKELEKIVRDLHETSPF